MDKKVTVFKTSNQEPILEVDFPICCATIIEGGEMPCGDQRTLSLRSGPGDELLIPNGKTAHTFIIKASRMTLAGKTGSIVQGLLLIADESEPIEIEAPFLPVPELQAMLHVITDVVRKYSPTHIDIVTDHENLLDAFAAKNPLIARWIAQGFKKPGRPIVASWRLLWDTAQVTQTKLVSRLPDTQRERDALEELWEKARECSNRKEPGDLTRREQRELHDSEKDTQLLLERALNKDKDP